MLGAMATIAVVLRGWRAWARCRHASSAALPISAALLPPEPIGVFALVRARVAGGSTAVPSVPPGPGERMRGTKNTAPKARAHARTASTTNRPPPDDDAGP